MIDEDARTLASALAAALDSACAQVDGMDLSTLPDNVQQSLALTRAARVAVYELLEVMGVDAEGQRTRLLEERLHLERLWRTA